MNKLTIGELFLNLKRLHLLVRTYLDSSFINYSQSRRYESIASKRKKENLCNSSRCSIETVLSCVPSGRLKSNFQKLANRATSLAEGKSSRVDSMQRSTVVIIASWNSREETLTLVVEP